MFITKYNMCIYEYCTSREYAHLFNLKNYLMIVGWVHRLNVTTRVCLLLLNKIIILLVR